MKKIIIAMSLMIIGSFGASMAFPSTSFAESKDNDSLKSISVAKNYIKQYTNSNGENFYFAIAPF